MTMREKIARAIWDYEIEACDGKIEWHEMDPILQRSWLRCADAILDAMMEPTPAMVEEGRWPAEDDGPVACWKAMITAAKEEK